MSRTRVRRSVTGTISIRRSFGFWSLALVILCAWVVVFAWMQWPIGTDDRQTPVGPQYQGAGIAVAKLGAEPASLVHGADPRFDPEGTESRGHDAVRPVDSPQRGSARDAEWLAIPKTSRSLARDFALAPAALRVDQLVRHADLNPTDQPLSQESLVRLQQLMRRHQDLIRQSLKKYGLDRHALLKDLDESGALAEVSTSNGEPMALGVAAFLMRDGRTFVARKDQLRGLELSDDYYRDLRAAFLSDVLSWFLAAGLTNHQAIAHIVEEFRGLV
jgi:hypothetical protein